MKLVILILLSLFPAIQQTGTYRDKVIGLWLSEDKKGKIEISEKSGKYYGKIVWVDKSEYVNGEPKKDIKNPDPKLRTRSSLGLEILKDFSYDADDKEWSDGTIYDPLSGSTYSCYMWFDDNDFTKLNIRGYIGFSLLGRTTVWARVKE